LNESPAQVALNDIAQEHRWAIEHFPAMRSPHEGYAIILEELEELWEEVKKQHNERDKTKMRNEAMQVAAMAMRFMVDCT
jgi:hypothetical protein